MSQVSRYTILAFAILDITLCGIPTQIPANFANENSLN